MRHLLALALLVALPTAARAQTATVAPGMSRAQVVAAFGEPVNARSANEYTYLFYRNDCGKACGMNDLVILRRDSVVDAILRSSTRRYSGTSSSPAPLTRGEARSGAASPKPMTMPAQGTAAAAVPARRAAPAQAVPLRKDVASAEAPAASGQARAARTDSSRNLIASNPALVEQLRRRLLASGLTATQIRARLKAEGYPENLLDEYMRSAAASSAPPASRMKPGAPTDTHPSTPAAAPAVRPAPAPTSTKPTSP